MNPGSPDATPPRRKYPTEFQRRMMWLAITAVSMLAAGAVGVYTIGVIADVLQFLQPVLVPIAFAGILAYLLEPIVKKLTDRGTPRFRAMMLVWLGFHGLIILLFFSVAVPTIQSATKYMNAEKRDSLVKGVSNFLTTTVDGVDKFVGKFRGGDKKPEEPAESKPVDQHPVETHTVREGETIPSIAAWYSLSPADLESLNAGRTVAPGLILQLPANAKPGAVHTDGKQSWVKAKITSWFAENGEGLAAKVTGGLSRSFQGFIGIFGYLVGFVLVPLYLYYFLKESAAIQRGWSHYIPLRASKFKAELVDCLTEINGYLIAFFRGQMLVSMIDGLLVGICLALIGLPYAMLIGVFVAMLGLIPYVGNMLCWFTAVAVSIAHFGEADPKTGQLLHTLWGLQDVWAYPLIVTGIFVVVQQINSLVTAPRIVGDAVGLHPLTVIFSVLFWSLLIGGLLGALLAVPFTASLKVILRRYIWELKVQPQLAAPAEYPVS